MRDLWARRCEAEELADALGGEAAGAKAAKCDALRAELEALRAKCDTIEAELKVAADARAAQPLIQVAERVDEPTPSVRKPSEMLAPASSPSPSTRRRRSCFPNISSPLRWSLVKARTSWPPSSKARTTCCPTLPVAPATATRIFLLHIDAIATGPTIYRSGCDGRSCVAVRGCGCQCRDSRVLRLPFARS